MLKVKVDTKEKALSTIYSWSNTKAGIKILDYFNPEGEKVCFHPNGNHFVTIPADVVKSMGLRP